MTREQRQDRREFLKTIARHDLLFHGVGMFGLQWDHRYQGLGLGYCEARV
ncbi:MAG: hypothetical protein QGH94_11360 [Phycisphaerae bacterium]|jgi:hypothetical protein|nr:hypothetical protein [Phycisphaerae bacterium]